MRYLTAGWESRREMRQQGCRAANVTTRDGKAMRLTCVKKADAHRVKGTSRDINGASHMANRIATGIIVCAVIGLTSTWAQAGPCSSDIAQFEAAIRQSASNPMAGLSARQTVAAQLDRQPTVASMKQEEARLKSQFAATMARAKRLDAKGDRKGCNSALNAAKRMYIL